MYLVLTMDVGLESHRTESLLTKIESNEKEEISSVYLAQYLLRAFRKTTDGSSSSRY